MKGIRENLRTRMGSDSPNVEGVAADIASRAGGVPADYVKELEGGGDGREALYQRAASATNPGALVRLNDMLAGTSAMSRAGQVGVYGGIGAGGALGLTAAGQQLLSLMEYLQQGQATDAKRDQELA